MISKLGQIDGQANGNAEKARVANSLIFLVCGFAVSSWAPLIPLAKTRLHLDNAALGTLLLFYGTGAILTMPTTPGLLRKFGVKRVVIANGFLLALVLPLLLFINSVIMMAGALLVFGAATGSMDISMNGQAVLIQERYGRHIMSSFHGLYSTGGLFGSLGFSFLLSLGLSPVKSILSISVLLILITLSQANKLISGADIEVKKAGRGFSFPTGIVLALGIMAFIVALTEGAMLDWSALFITSYRNYQGKLTGLGYAMFSIAMAIMRLTGDSIVNKLGQKRTVIYCGIIAATGMFLLVTLPFVLAALIGFILIGIGCANIIPIFFSTAGKLASLLNKPALPPVILMAYGGILAGPALIGFISEYTSLPFVFGLIGILVAVITIAFTRIKVGNNAK